MDEMTRTAAETIWNYMHTGDAPGPATCLVVLGSRDDRVASYAARVAQMFTFGTIVVTGGIAHRHDLLATTWGEGSEAAHFAAIMQNTGLTQELLLETEATNTGENALNTYQLLEERGVRPQSLLVVTKPYMERRAKATFEIQWPAHTIQLRVVSPPGTLDEYVSTDQPLEMVLAIMVGDMQRILEYPARGLQSEQPVPRSVKEAYQALVAAGYTNHML